jgi:hypothetical protein
LISVIFRHFFVVMTGTKGGECFYFHADKFPYSMAFLK